MASKASQADLSWDDDFEQEDNTRHTTDQHDGDIQPETRPTTTATTTSPPPSHSPSPPPSNDPSGSLSETAASESSHSPTFEANNDIDTHPQTDQTSSASNGDSATLTQRSHSTPPFSSSDSHAFEIPLNKESLDSTYVPYKPTPTHIQPEEDVFDWN